jgi:hypothetical protein
MHCAIILAVEEAMQASSTLPMRGGGGQRLGAVVEQARIWQWAANDTTRGVMGDMENDTGTRDDRGY